MASPDVVKVREGYAYIHLSEPLSIPALVEVARQAVAICKERTLPLLLVDLRDVPRPWLSLVDRYAVVSTLAVFWDRSIRTAVVSREAEAALDQFAMMVAQNRGIQVGLFTEEAEAVAWLLEKPEG